MKKHKIKLPRETITKQQAEKLASDLKTIKEVITAHITLGFDSVEFAVGTVLHGKKN